MFEGVNELKTGLNSALIYTACNPTAKTSIIEWKSPQNLGFYVSMDSIIPDMNMGEEP